MYIMEINVRDLQDVLYKMMKDFHNVCIKNDITYYMLGGTCLGAKRHQGFIPWDDDMDIGIPRKDYDRFCYYAKKWLPNYMELRYYRNTSNSPFHFVKLINKNTTLIEQNYKNYYEGIYIDIFPLDGVLSQSFLERIRCKMVWKVHSIIMDHCSSEKKKTFFDNMKLRIKKIISLRWLHYILEKLMTLNKKHAPLFWANFLGAYREKEVVPCEVFGVPTLYKFEEAQFFGPEKIDDYLSILYGDYMKLPPVKERKNYHNYYFVDFDTPYKNYLHHNKSV